MAPRFIDIKQSTPEWLQWRKLKITASMAGTIMGLNPFESCFSLWKRLIDDIPLQKTERMERGHRLEIVARDLINAKYGTSYHPICVENEFLPWKASSIDGWDEKAKIKGMEIKAPNEKTHRKAMDGELEPYYMAQIQHQLDDLQVDKWLYVSYDEKSEPVEVVVNRDDAYIEKLLIAEKEFYRCLLEFDPPPLTEKDIRICADLKALEMAQERTLNLMAMDRLAERNKVIEEQLKGFVVDDMPTKIGTLTVRQIVRKGNVEYGKIPALQGINLDEFRKPNSKYWRFS